MSKSNKSILILAITLLLILIAAYANHFHNGFHFDDSHTVESNVYIRNLKNIPAFFNDPKMFSSDPLHWGLRPLVTTSLAIDYWLGGGLNPFYFQLSTFLWYVLLGVLLFFTYKKLLDKSIAHPYTGYLALAATAWYILHTSNAETVNYVIARSDVLSTLFIVASFLTYLTYKGKLKWFFCILLAFLGVFTKETVLVLVIIMFFYVLLFEKELSISDLFKPKNLKHLWAAFVKILPLFIVILITQAYTLSKITQSSGFSNSTSYYSYILTQSYVWLHYFIAFFLPMNLSADSDWGVIKNIFDERIIIGLIFIILLVIAIFKTSSKRETLPIAFGLIWFSAALLPTSIAPFSEVTNDHRMLFPFIGLSLSIVTYIGLWLSRLDSAMKKNQLIKKLTLLFFMVILGLNAYGIHQRNKIWKDEESLWYDVTVKSPLNGRGLMNYGLTQMGKGRYDIAEEYYEKAIPYLPYYNTLYINIGILKGAINKPAEAEENFKKAIVLSPNTYDSYVYYARYLKQINRDTDAVQMAQKALQINPYSTMAMQVLMAAYNNLGIWDKLQQVAIQALELLPGDPAALSYLQAGKTHTQVVFLAKQPANKKLNAADYLNLSLTYYNQHDYTKSIDACLQAIKLKPDYADAYSNMGAAYNMLKQWDKGYAACLKALQINPDHKLAKGNLNWAKSQLNIK